MTVSTDSDKQVGGAGESVHRAELSNSLPKDTLGKIGAALLEHVKKFPDVFKVIHESKLPQRDDL